MARALERVLKEDGDPSIRVNAALGLKNWGTPESIAALQEAAEKDPNWIVRSRAGTSDRGDPTAAVTGAASRNRSAFTAAARTS